MISLLLLCSALVCSVEAVQSLKCISGPDDESSQMASRGEFEEVQSGDVDEVHSRQVSEGFHHRGILLKIDDQRSSLLDVSSVSGLSLSWSDVSRFLDSFNIVESIDGLEECGGSGGFIDGVDGLVVDDQRNLGDVFNSVSSSQ